MYLFALIVITGLTGFYAAFATDWNGAFYASLILHPLFGLVSTVAICVFVGKHLDRRQLPIRGYLVLAIPALIGLYIALKPTVGDATVWIRQFAAATFVILAYLALVSRYAQASRRGFLLYALWVALLMSGAALIPYRGIGQSSDLFLLHRYLAFVFMGVFAVYLVWLRLDVISRQVGKVLARPFTIPVLALVALAVMVEASWESTSRVTLFVSTQPDAERKEGELSRATVTTHRPAHAVAAVASCIDGAACHQSMKHDFENSAHNFSMSTPHMHKLLDLMTEELESDNRTICLGCHIPDAAMKTEIDYGERITRPNLGCGACHLVDAVNVGTRNERTAQITYAIPDGHVRLFVDDFGARKLTQWERDAILLSPLNHGARFNGRLIRSDQLCLACHFNEITAAPKQMGRLERPRCVECHMPPEAAIGGDSHLRSHLFPGANVNVALLSGVASSRSITTVSDWARGMYKYSLGGWGNVWVLDRSGAGVGSYGEFESPLPTTARITPKMAWLTLVIDFEQPPVSGRPFEFSVITSNVGMEHPFPAGPLDLIDAWLDVSITSERGVVLFSSGAVNDDGQIDVEARRLGGQVFEDGLPAKNYRVWRHRTEVVERVIQPGYQVEDFFKFTPEASGSIYISAQWRYRKLTPEFTSWAYSKTIDLKSIVVGETSAKLNVNSTAKVQ